MLFKKKISTVGDTISNKHIKPSVCSMLDGCHTNNIYICSKCGSVFHLLYVEDDKNCCTCGSTKIIKQPDVYQWRVDTWCNWSKEQE